MPVAAGTSGPLEVELDEIAVHVSLDATVVSVASGDRAFAVNVGPRDAVSVRVVDPPALVAVGAQPQGGVVLADQAPVHVTVADAGGGGAPGASAYELAVARGYAGTLDAWLASLSGRTEEAEFVLTADGAQPLTLPAAPSAVQAYFLNGLRERRSNFACAGAVVTTPSFVVTGDLVVVVYYP